MAFYICDGKTGELVSSCPNDGDQVASAEELAAKGLELVKGFPLDETHVWDAASKSVIVVQAPIKPHLIDNYQFILSFTPQEYDNIVKSGDLQVKLLLEALRSIGQIDLNGATTRNGIGYIVSKGLLVQDRADAILAGP